MANGKRSSAPSHNAANGKLPVYLESDLNMPGVGIAVRIHSSASRSRVDTTSGQGSKSAALQGSRAASPG